MEELDRRAVEWLSSLHWPVVTPVMKGLTYIGAGGTVWIVIALALAFRQRRPLVLVAAVATIIVSSRLDAILKDAIGRARPFVGDPSVHPSIALPHDPSMPSGHAMNAFAGAVLLGSVVPRARWALLALACAIALSRVYLGVHFPSDVLAGAALGAGLGAAAAWLLPRAEAAVAAWRTKRGQTPSGA
ncbi:MAG TPA: phosphatase PAP2 family protein [Gaiellales bacterium]|nr:phosphatase PAP2 family protein [Gaiellales bacterium]